MLQTHQAAQEQLKRLTSSFDFEKVLNVLDLMTTIESMFVYVHFNPDNADANFIQKQLLDFVQTELEKKDTQFDEYIKFLTNMQTKLTETPLTDDDVRKWKLDSFPVSKKPFIPTLAPEIQNGLKKLPESSASAYEYEPPGNCMREALTEFNTKAWLLWAINNRKFNEYNKSSFSTTIKEHIVDKLEPLIDQLYDRVMKDDCYKNSYYLTAIVFRLKRFIQTYDRNDTATEIERIDKWYGFFFLTERHKSDIKMKYLLDTYRYVATEVRRTPSKACYYNRLLIILREFETIHLYMQGCMHHESDCLNEGVARFRNMWKNEATFATKFNCHEPRYMNIIKLGQSMLDFENYPLSGDLKRFSDWILISDGAMLHEHYNGLLTIMSSDATIKSQYIDEQTEPMAKALLAYFENTRKHDALDLCKEKDKISRSDEKYYKTMISHYQKFLSWIEYRAAGHRIGKFHLIIHQIRMSLRTGYRVMVDNFDKLDQAIESSGRKRP